MRALISFSRYRWEVTCDSWGMRGGKYIPYVI